MQQIKATANYSKRTFTIRKQDNKGRTLSKYRTNQLTYDELFDFEFNTSNDWLHFLNTSLYYHQIK